MVTLDQTLISVEKNATVGESLLTLFAAMKQQLADALSGVTLPPAVQAKVDAIFAASEADTAKMEEAILANTPQEPTE